MFVQVFQGPVSDPAQVRQVMDQWVTELGPTADGWLGSTAGVTDEGWFVGLARFDSESAARAATATDPSRVSGGRGWRRSSRASPHSTRAPRSSWTTTATSTRPGSSR